MFRRSDINQRLPRFRETLAAVEDVRKQGALEDVSPSVLDRLAAMEPVGLDSKGRPVIARDHDLVTQPPIVMLLPGEVGRTARHEGTSPVIRSAQHILRLTGIEGTPPAAMFEEKYQISDNDAWVHHTNFTIAPAGDQARKYTISFPRLLYIGSAVGRSMLGSVVTHEVDHWDFYHEEAPRIQSDPARRLEAIPMQTLAEKRAYRLTYQMECAMGNYGALEPVEILARRYIGTDPQDSLSIYRDLVDRREAAGVTRLITAPLAALALEQVFGSQDQLVTADEVTAYSAAGLV